MAPHRAGPHYSRRFISRAADEPDLAAQLKDLREENARLSARIRYLEGVLATVVKLAGPYLAERTRTRQIVRR